MANNMIPDDELIPMDEPMDRPARRPAPQPQQSAPATPPAQQGGASVTPLPVKQNPGSQERPMTGRQGKVIEVGEDGLLPEVRNRAIWERYRDVPAKYVRPIEGGRKKGLSAIDPIFRLEALTTLFGPVGVGWKYKIKTKETIYHVTTQNGAVIEGEHLLEVKMKFKYHTAKSGWSEPIVAIGTAKPRVFEKGSYYIDEEAPKKAITDALSQVCKMLGIGANVYSDKSGQNNQQNGYRR